jgi:tol-pal system protein YbgF
VKKVTVKAPEKPAAPAQPTQQPTQQASSTKVANKKIRQPTHYEKETYKAAFNKIKVSPTAATRAFKEYIKMQPNSPLSANAQYWIGEIMYSHNNYKGAVQEFIKVLQSYKFSEKAPDAAIKLGYSFYALKKWDLARRTFEDVLRFFPENKNVVNLANKRLEKMKEKGK